MLRCISGVVLFRYNCTEMNLVMAVNKTIFHLIILSK